MKNFDQAVDEMMHGDTAELRRSVIAEATEMGANSLTLDTLGRYNHAQLVNWWISYFKWSERNQIWMFRRLQTQK